MCSNLAKYEFPGVSDISCTSTKVETVQEQFSIAIKRMETVALDCYNTVSALTIHWESDETGSHKDSNLFIKTISKLGKWKRTFES